MDNRIMFGIAFAGIVFWSYKQTRLRKRVDILEEMVENVMEIMEIQFQQEVDARFEEIVEEYEDDE